jgi:hypothetical protein
LAAARFPQQKILEDESPLPDRKWSTTSVAGYLRINGFRPSLGFDDVVKCAAIRAFEKNTHDTRTEHSLPKSIYQN